MRTPRAGHDGRPSFDSADRRHGVDWQGKSRLGLRRPYAQAFEISYRDGEGRWRHRPLTEVADLPFPAYAPVREPTMIRHRVYSCGWYWFARASRFLVYESLVERRVLLELDFDPDVVDVATQPFSFHERAGRIGHVPDVLADRVDGSRDVIDVKPARRRKDALARRLLALMEPACASIGWRYQVRSQPDEQRLRNLTWLACNRRRPPALERYAGQLLAACAEPVAIDEAVRAIGPAAAVRPVLFHLLWTHRLKCDLDRPLTDATRVRAAAT
jgi:hypothetical protein